MDKSAEVFEKRLFDLENMAIQKGIVVFTDFMNLNELNILHNNRQKFSISWDTFGGYEFAERQMAAFMPDALYYDWNYPITCLQIDLPHARYSDKLTHRDYLGAILNLGIERRAIGDIIVDTNHAYLFCTDKMSDFIVSELCRIRSTTVSCKKIVDIKLSFHLKTEHITGTVASIRLDSILAVAFQASRSSLVGLIEGGKVFVNGRLVVSNGYTLKENDIISARGLGKFRYLHTISQTKKGRYLVELEKYI